MRNLKEETFYLASYFDSRMRGLDDNYQTSDATEAEDWAWEHLNQGGYVEIKNQKTGKEVYLDPDDLLDDYADYASGAFEDAINDSGVLVDPEWHDTADQEQVDQPDYIPDGMDESMGKEIKRYSDVYSDERRNQGWWYFTTHGVQPGSVPKDVNILEVRDTPNGTYFRVDAILNTSELKYYDIKERVPKEEEYLKESASMDSAQRLEDDGWTVLSHGVRGGDSNFYWLARRMNKERGKADWKAINDKTGEVIDITYEQALEREPIGVSSGVSKLSKKLGKVLLPQKINIRESLNKYDLRTDNKYDLRNLYDACIMTDKEKRTIAEMIAKNTRANVLYEALMNKFEGKELKETLDQEQVEDTKAYVYEQATYRPNLTRDGHIEIDEYHFEDMVNDALDYEDCTEEEAQEICEEVKKLIEGIKYYRDSWKLYIELSDNRTLWGIDVPDGVSDAEVESVYEMMLGVAFDDFQEETGVDLTLLGRSGRHVCVDNTYENAKRYSELVSVQKEVEDRFIKNVNDELRSPNEEEYESLKESTQKKSLKESHEVEYLERELAEKSLYPSIEDAYERNELTICKFRDSNTYYLQNCPNRLYRLVKKEMGKYYPELKYLYDESLKEAIQPSHLKNLLVNFFNSNFGGYGDPDNKVLSVDDVDINYRNRVIEIHTMTFEDSSYNFYKDYENYQEVDMDDLSAFLWGKAWVSDDHEESLKESKQNLTLLYKNMGGSIWKSTGKSGERELHIIDDKKGKCVKVLDGSKYTKKDYDNLIRQYVGGSKNESLKEDVNDMLRQKAEPLANALDELTDRDDGFYITYSIGMDDNGIVTGGVDFELFQSSRTEEEARAEIERVFDENGFELDRRYKTNPGKTLFGRTHYQIIERDTK